MKIDQIEGGVSRFEVPGSKWNQRIYCPELVPGSKWNLLLPELVQGSKSTVSAQNFTISVHVAIWW